MKKVFGNIKISWKFLIIFSCFLGILVGILNRLSFLNGTSFQDIAIVLDMWIILAIFIIVNCKSIKEAVFKCFVFFLISQPLIYFTEVLIDVFVKNNDFMETLTLYFRNYYIGAGWLYWTFLTIPGACVAYQVKKNNILSAIILSVATGYLSLSGITGIINMFKNNSFPYHLLNSIICLFMAYYLIIILLSKKKERIISCILTSMAMIIGIFLLISASNKPINSSDMITLENNKIIASYKITNENIATAKIENDGEYLNIFSSKDVGTTSLIIKDQNGEIYKYIIESTDKKFEIRGN